MPAGGDAFDKPWQLAHGAAFAAPREASPFNCACALPATRSPAHKKAWQMTRIRRAACCLDIYFL
jgi:hypothetical protein